MSDTIQIHHVLSPKATLLSDSEAEKVLSEYKLDNVYNLPKVDQEDKSLQGLVVKPGSVIKYSRSTGDYYRVVVAEE